MSFRSYEAYKDSGVEWLGHVPSSWTHVKLKHLAALNMGQSPSSDECNREGDGLPFLQGCAEFGRRTPSPEQYCPAPPKQCLAGDILFSVRAPVGAMNIADQVYGVGRGLCAITVHSASPRFLEFALNWLRVQLNAISTGSTFEAVSLSQLASLALVIPPFDEQAAITAFLDRETAKIDALIEEQQRLIALLKEKRQAVISHAVTKGLDPNAPMKASGVEWLGDVPAHWDIRKLSSAITKITNGYVGPTRDILVDEGVRYLQSLHIKNNSIRFDTPYFVTEDWNLAHSKSILMNGDVLIVQTGDIGQVAVVTDEFAGCNCHALIVVSPIWDVLAGDWLSWVLNSDYGFHTLVSIQTGALHPHLNCGNVRDVFIPLPPKAEQKKSPLSFMRRLVVLMS